MIYQDAKRTFAGLFALITVFGICVLGCMKQETRIHDSERDIKLAELIEQLNSWDPDELQAYMSPVANPNHVVHGETTYWIEERIDHFNRDLPPLESFVLPGGSPTAAALHAARTVCRRAERLAVGLAQAEAIGENVIPYLNRLSDLCFVLARVANRRGEGDVLWVPGANRTS